MEKYVKMCQNSDFPQILTHLGIFDPLRVKISTLPPPCFMIYYIFYKSKKYQKFKIPEFVCIPLLGVAPRDPRVWPLGAREGLTKGPRYLLSDFLCQNAFPLCLEPGLIRVKRQVPTPQWSKENFPNCLTAGVEG